MSTIPPASEHREPEPDADPADTWAGVEAGVEAGPDPWRRGPVVAPDGAAPVADDPWATTEVAAAPVGDEWPAAAWSPVADPIAPPPAPAPPGPSTATWPAEPPRRGAPPLDPAAGAAAPVRPRTPGWVTPLVVLAALALFAGGVLTGRSLATDDDAPAPVDTTGTATDGAAAPAPAGPVSSDDVEPAAAVAAAVAPSVVQLETTVGLGSGVIYDADGHILTAAHVLEGVEELTVRLADGTRLAGRVVGADPATDVGVVAIDAPPGLRPAVLAIGVPLEVGQLAVAVGSPFGLEQTVTAGIVSAIDRAVITDGGVVGMIQTDASINPGNSGGALADRQGRVIGINDAIRTTGGGNEGVGFAIPITLAADIADRLVSGQPVEAGFLGVSGTNPTSGAPGALVTEVVTGSPAADAGLEAGDLITAVDGESIRQMSDLAARIRARSPGQLVVLDVIRDDGPVRVEVVLTSAGS